MFFRPEEIHGASGKGRIFKPFPEGNGHIGDHLLRIGLEYFAVPNVDLHWKSAIQAGGLDFNYFPGKEPADRQRFESSLAEPLLLAVHSDSVLRGEVTERRETADIVGLRKQPDARNSYGHKVVSGLSGLLERDL